MLVSAGPGRKTAINRDPGMQSNVNVSKLPPSGNPGRLGLYLPRSKALNTDPTDTGSELPSGCT